MFNKILIANRGEIALRVLRACKDLGVKTLAVYSEADVDSLHVQLADEAICIGRGPADNSYLKIDRIISAAEIGDVDAIHPGYGFLAENVSFAETCESCNIKLIGPSSQAISTMGDKAKARETARRAGVPTTPGSPGVVENEQDALKIAEQIGFPVMIKAVAGGGGRGMRPCHNDVSLAQNLHAARVEAEKSFGNGAVYLEKLIVNPRHIEFQIMADQHGRTIHLGERHCSLQRRNQKLIEESPSPVVTPALRKAMGRASVKLAEACGYEGAGTIEFLVDADNNFYFMEMNTRIQVEHPVTEEVYGVDLVKEQILIAAGEKMSQTVVDAEAHGYTVEVRINAEDPFQNFRPSPGVIELFCPPGGIGVRFDSHAYAGYVIPPYYDSMIGKLIVSGPDRETALNRCNRALSEFIVRGVKTTIPFAQMLINDQGFRAGNVHTKYLEQWLEKKGQFLK